MEDIDRYMLSYTPENNSVFRSYDNILSFFLFLNKKKRCYENTFDYILIFLKKFYNFFVKKRQKLLR